MKTALKKLCIFHGELDYEGKCAVYLVDVDQPAPVTPGPWVLAGEVYVINHLARPIGTNMKLFEITRNEAFPYNSNNIFIVLDPFTHPVRDNKVFFISYNFPVQNTVPIYIFRDLSDDSVFLSFTKDVPYPFLTKDYYQEFWALKEPIDGWECVEGVVMPNRGGDGLVKTLIGCPTQTFSLEEKQNLSLPLEREKDKKHWVALGSISIAIIAVVFFSLIRK